MKFDQDRKLVVGFAVVGVILMTLTIVWRVNPVEGSVIPTFLTNNPVGRAVVGCLLVTCLPVLIVSVWIGTLLKIVPFPVIGGLMIFLQALAYGLIGKGVSIVFRKISRKI